MTDRDHFAAAALTGLLAQGDDGSFSEESYVRSAYRWADAMLRERARTNHDAVPAAIARTDSATGEPGGGHGSSGTDKPVTLPVLGAGDTQEPAAWIAFATDGSESSAVYSLYEHARAAADEWNWDVAPLYLQPKPTLTDAEQQAIADAIDVFAESAIHIDNEADRRRAATLRGLLRRLA